MYPVTLVTSVVYTAGLISYLANSVHVRLVSWVDSFVISCIEHNGTDGMLSQRLGYPGLP